ncbi:hypothetical protein OF83DRAFT_1179943 [Amylostereum chailletii]|nr:hypothetical protein OF83DRAFT_1179943 [Amylostereum chailletii]
MNSVQQQNLYVNPNAPQAVATSEASRMQNEAMALEARGDLAGAERLILRAIEIRNQAFGAGNNYVAINQNSLGEIYIKMGRLDEAESVLKSALETRTRMNNAFDAGVTRENLAQLYEARGDAKAAHEMRMRGSPKSLVCGNQKCPGQLFTVKQLQRCGGCKSIMYCTQPCQTADWKRHKGHCALLKAAATA